ncbi:MAG: hypothetical protein PHW69_02435, partial [Elusimicrobiaceae bacterium]|nr:hypothetical protein [Elusimicrobiaceae bacterium]
MTAGILTGPAARAAALRRGLFWRLRGILFIYFAAGAALLPWFVWQVDADGISYISIARRYLEGDFGGALNGYWGPLLSWALAAFMAAGIKPLLAAKLFGLLSGGALLAGLHRLLGLTGCGGKPRATFLYAFMPVVYSYFCNIISPDLAVAVFTVWYLAWALNRNYIARPCYAVYCGLAGALAFFSKSYALPFFMAHFTVVNALRYYRLPQMRTTVLNRWLTGLFTFFFVAAPWIIAVSYKYGPVTFSTTGGYNAAIVGPRYRGHPVNYEGLFAPKDVKALSVWEDPSRIPVRRWSVFSPGGLAHQLRLVADNSLSAVWILEVVSLFSLLALGWLAARGIREWQMRSEPVHLYLALAVFIYCAGYTLITVRARYLYPVFAIVFAAGAGGVAALMR